MPELLRACLQHRSSVEGYSQHIWSHDTRHKRPYHVESCLEFRMVCRKRPLSIWVTIEPECMVAYHTDRNCNSCLMLPGSGCSWCVKALVPLAAALSTCGIILWSYGHTCSRIVNEYFMCGTEQIPDLPNYSTTLIF